ncbi:MAG: tRNA (adenosine(37)-N6)-dimethylallyltransferase MiaA [Pseudomonadota bacterium]|nr:tRNA (adenosine(37)-N6)-dimethylallyltransferase MiaA [Pseudomonadota bacterium]
MPSGAALDPASLCLCLVGPTAAGKSAAAMALAAALAPTTPIEIVSVDSALVYRGLDIGTAKPSRAERQRVPHHLIDIVDPADPYSAARFVADARHAVADIVARGAVPLLVGGTMLYLHALFEGLDALPSADAALRAEIDAEAERVGWPALHQRLVATDPATAARLAPNDAQRIQRALEVERLSGKPMSSWLSGRGRGRWPRLFSLEPASRATLHARIEERVAAMLATGLVDEVVALRRRPDLSVLTPSIRAVGYRQTWAALDAGDGSGLADRIAAATRQLAKRQLTWLRRMPWREVVACDGLDPIAEVVDRVGPLARALRVGPV